LGRAEVGEHQRVVAAVARTQTEESSHYSFLQQDGSRDLGDSDEGNSLSGSPFRETIADKLDAE